ncbi:MAG: hypothetical protein SGPRY_014758, partial [Prymnesium sp.]
MAQLLAVTWRSVVLVLSYHFSIGSELSDITAELTRALQAWGQPQALAFLAAPAREPSLSYALEDKLAP